MPGMTFEVKYFDLKLERGESAAYVRDNARRVTSTVTFMSLSGGPW
jgi:hypothetical protein